MKCNCIIEGRDLKIERLRSLLQDESEEYTLDLLRYLSEYSGATLAKKLIIILNSEIRKESLLDSIYIFKIFPYLSSIFQSEKNINYDNLLEIVNEAYYAIQDRLQNPNDSINKNETDLLIAKKTINLIEELKLIFLYDFKNHYYGDKYSLMKYLIFDEKNSDYVKEAISSFPYMANITDRNHVMLFENLVYIYLEELYGYAMYHSLSDKQDILYYNKVIDIFINSPKFIIDNKMRNRIEEKIKSYQSINFDEFTDVGYEVYKFELDKLADKISIYANKSTSVKKLAYNFNIATDFDPAIVGEFHLLKKPIDTKYSSLSSIFDRDYIVSIDGEGTREIDDALSVFKDGDNLILGVHLASPTEFIPQNSLINEDARTRTSSVYFDNSYMIPMLPPAITENYLSLNHDKPRYATSYFFTISPEGEIISEKFMKTIINVNKNLTYNSANSIINSNIGDERLVETLNNLSLVSDRLKNGYFRFDDVYEKIKKTNQDVTGSRISGDTRAEKIVEYCMALVNNRVAKYASNKGFPFIYRNHVIDASSKTRLEEYKNNIKFSRDSDEIKSFLDHLSKLMPRGYYGIENAGHAGLGLDAYSHCTSPIRRYADMANEYALDTWYFHKPSDAKLFSLESEFNMISKEINSKQESINDFVKRYVYCKRCNQAKK